METDPLPPIDLPECDEQAAGQVRPVTAARCAVELAWADALARSSGQRLCGPVPPALRVSGVLGSADPARTARQLLLLRLLGLRDFKLKLGLGDPADAENLRLVHARIGRAVAAGRCTLRVDVNGGWPAVQTPARAAELKRLGVCVIEQPVFGPPATLVELAGRCELPLMADESMVTTAHATELLRHGGGRVWLNIRLSKNGGLGPCRRIAQAAADAGTPFVVGCMVGESGILSAAQRCLLASCPPPRFVEGNYGRLLLKGDLTARSLRFSYGGRLKGLRGAGLGVDVDPRRLARCARCVQTLRA